ncbi:unnamed protein product [Dovyalis caffra]|uniref:Uncharacterized protein n=1 Tax=Dovyalis caffra TaxID=77055 RepID=A0AAV1S084_9ROSI|nr:unnamed protein product [Dovyalis caffra]
MPSSSYLEENQMFKSQINSTSFDGPSNVENALGTDNRYFDVDISTGAPYEFLNEEPPLEGLWEMFNTSKNSSSQSGILEEESFEALWETFNTSKKLKGGESVTKKLMEKYIVDNALENFDKEHESSSSSKP